jgi:long-chain acyl-CoA synthetase
VNNLYDIISTAAELYGQKVFLDCPSEEGRREISYKEFDQEVNILAQKLIRLGVKSGDRVSFLTPKTKYQAYLFFAVWRVNAIAVPVSESMGDEEVSFIIADADPSLVVLHSSLMPRASVIADQRQVVSFADLNESSATEGLPVLTLKLDDIAALIYTSGSTGCPKGVMLSHRNLMVNARSSGDAIVIQNDERILSLLPYWHSFALIAELVMIPMAQGTVIFPKDRRDFARNMASFNSTMMLVVPRMLAQFKLMLEKEVEKLGQLETLAACLANAEKVYIKDGFKSQDPNVRSRHDVFHMRFLSQLKKAFGNRFKFFIGGGAPLAKDLQVFFRNIELPVMQGYGLTETSPVISCNTLENNHMGSSGKLISWLRPGNGGDYTFMDSEGNRSKDIEGELLVKGDSVMLGYWGHKDESAKSLQDGWLFTGDVGRMQDGYLFITGRASNLLVLKGGEKVHPEHVEDILKKCSLIKEVMLIGEKCKNIYGVVNVEENELEDVYAAVKAEMSEVITGLAPFQKPRDILILPDFNPEDGTMTSTLKIRRKNIWSIYNKQLNGFLADHGEDA